MWFKGAAVYHDSNARGLLLKTKPIVLGFVACSRAYADPVAFQAFQRLSPSCSTSVSAKSFTADAGRLIEQKLTDQGQVSSSHDQSMTKSSREKGLTMHSYGTCQQSIAFEVLRARNFTFARIVVNG